ncbi:bifunctional arginine demethylase and lysyl-hydroxylase JMJD6-like [Ornithodoros turicata]|uniref:bifunctional arginine demethylase and lysyl-hydroxylase JMJD6-like n=1 Tax=Ornithodoros turicata TaxID=34597 RepID=UPI003139B2E1
MAVTSYAFHTRKTYLSLAVVLLALVWYLELHCREGWIKLWLWQSDVEREFCLVETPPKVQNAFMPPVDCSICKGLSQVERRQKLTPQEFQQRYAYSGVPLVITDAAHNWTALETFSLTFFRNLYEGAATTSSSKHYCQFFPYKTEFKNLYDVFNMSPERAKSPWYIGWSNCNPSVADILRKHYQRPYFLPDHSEGSTLDWIFMGSPGYGAHMHIDHVGKPSWQAQIRGRKQWNLEPVPECYADCHNLQVVVDPGEIIVVDSNLWYHKTLIIGDELSIAIGSEYD